MNKEEDKLVPELRFPEFKGKDSWEFAELSEVLDEHGTTSKGDEEVFSVSVHKGVINQIEHLGRRFAADNTSHYKRVLPGDVIYTKSPTGDFRYGILKQSKIPNPVIVSPLYGVFTPETNAMGVILDAYFESIQRTFNYLESLVQKGAKNTINIKNDVFLSKCLFLPRNPKEQQKIADCLSSLDDLIQAETDKLEALHDHKKGLMQKLFPAKGKTVPELRFKEFEKDGEWVTGTIDDIADIASGGTPSRTKSEYWNGDIPWISTALIDFNEIEEAVEFITVEGLENSSAKLFPKDTILMAMYGQGKTRGKVGVLKIEAATNQACAALKMKIGMDAAFVFQNLAGRYEEIRSISNDGGQKNLSADLIKRIRFFHPDPETGEQEKIADCLSSLDKQIALQTNRIETLQKHKSGLMQGLFPTIES